jgi:hypothetical protein
MAISRRVMGAAACAGLRLDIRAVLKTDAALPHALGKREMRFAETGRFLELNFL